jgi:hypothetical protein
VGSNPAAPTELIRRKKALAIYRRGLIFGKHAQQVDWGREASHREVQMQPPLFERMRLLAA